MTLDNGSGSEDYGMVQHFKYHPAQWPTPGHFVTDAATWSYVKELLARDVRPPALVTFGRVEATFAGTRVYLDKCPWDCEEAAHNKAVQA